MSAKLTEAEVSWALSHPEVTEALTLHHNASAGYLNAARASDAREQGLRGGVHGGDEDGGETYQEDPELRRLERAAEECRARVDKARRVLDQHLGERIAGALVAMPHEQIARVEVVQPQEPKVEEVVVASDKVTCLAEGCGNPVQGRGLCQVHFARAYREVKAGRTTWEALEANRSSRAPRVSSSRKAPVEESVDEAEERPEERPEEHVAEPEQAKGSRWTLEPAGGEDPVQEWCATARDLEVEAIAECSRALAVIGSSERERVLRYLGSRFGS